MNENSPLITKSCAELNALCKLKRRDDAAIAKTVDDLIALVEDCYWCSRTRDDFDWPFDAMMEAGHYEDTIRLIHVILKKEYCCLDQGDLHLILGICNYRLERFEESATEFEQAIQDDEDYADEALPYLHKINPVDYPNE